MYRILDMHDLERTLVLLTSLNDAHTPCVASTRDHHQRTRIVLDVVGDLVGGDVHLELLDLGLRVKV